MANTAVPIPTKKPFKPSTSLPTNSPTASVDGAAIECARILARLPLRRGIDGRLFGRMLVEMLGRYPEAAIRMVTYGPDSIPENLSPGYKLEIADVRRALDRALSVSQPGKSTAATVDLRWLPILNRLKTDLSEAEVESWFAKATLGDIADGTATVVVPTRFLSSWLRDHYESKVLHAVAGEHPEVRRVTFVDANLYTQRGARRV